MHQEETRERVRKLKTEPSSGARRLGCEGSKKNRRSARGRATGLSGKQWLRKTPNAKDVGIGGTRSAYEKRGRRSSNHKGHGRQGQAQQGEWGRGAARVHSFTFMLVPTVLGGNVGCDRPRSLAVVATLRARERASGRGCGRESPPGQEEYSAGGVGCRKENPQTNERAGHVAATCLLPVTCLRFWGAPHTLHPVSGCRGCETARLLTGFTSFDTEGGDEA